jgi:hypothetical protein
MIKDGGEHYKMNDEMGISNSKAIENAHLKKALGWYIYRWQMGGHQWMLRVLDVILEDVRGAKKYIRDIGDTKF